MAGGGAAPIMGLSMRRTDRQHGGKKQQEGQQTSERWFCNEGEACSFRLQLILE